MLCSGKKNTPETRPLLVTVIPFTRVTVVRLSILYTVGHHQEARVVAGKISASTAVALVVCHAKHLTRVSCSDNLPQCPSRYTMKYGRIRPPDMRSHRSSRSHVDLVSLFIQYRHTRVKT